MLNINRIYLLSILTFEKDFLSRHPVVSIHANMVKKKSAGRDLKRTQNWSSFWSDHLFILIQSQVISLVGWSSVFANVTRENLVTLLHQSQYEAQLDGL